MAILIKGMAMPTEGEYNLTLYVCSDGFAYIDAWSFPAENDRFLAVPVPPHGRLGDLDALMQQIEHDTPLSTVFEKTMRIYLKNAPTVIEADPPQEE